MTRGTSGLIQLKQRVEVLEFDTGIFGREVPIGFDVIAIAVVLPGGDFLDEGCLSGDGAGEELRGKHTKLGLSQIEPAAVFGGVVPLETLDKPLRLGGRE